MILPFLGGPMPTNDASAIITGGFRGPLTSDFVDVKTMSEIQWNFYGCELQISGIVSFRANGGIPGETWNSTDVGFGFTVPGLTAGDPTFAGRIVSGEPPGGWATFWSLESSGTAAIPGSHTLYIESGSPTIDQYHIGYQFQFGSTGGPAEIYYDVSSDKYFLPFFCALTFSGRIFFGDPDDASSLGTACDSNYQETLEGYIVVGTVKATGDGTAIDTATISIWMHTPEDQSTNPNTLYFSAANVTLQATTLATL